MLGPPTIAPFSISYASLQGVQSSAPPPLNCAAQQVMQADALKADRVFQDVDAFFCVERPHLIQSF